nr:uncharacterized protein LOC117220653 isoform X1 [Megalopta genalis]
MYITSKIKAQVANMVKNKMDRYYNSEAVTVKGENYKVVDECNEEEVASNNTKTKITESSINIEKRPVNEQNINEQNANAQNMDEKKADEESLDVTILNIIEIKKKEDNLKKETLTEQKKSDLKEQDLTEKKNDEQNLFMEKKEDLTKVKEIVELVDLTDGVQSDDLNINNNDQNSETNECTKPSNGELIDFTADISLDQLSEQNNVTDEDVLQNLDEIENMVFTSSVFEMQDDNSKMVTEEIATNMEEQKSKDSNEADKDIEQTTSANDIKNTDIEVEVVEVINPVKVEWYEKKIAEKEAIIKERLTKMARIFGISYPCYEKWLEKEVKANGSLCKLKPARRCSLKKPYTNRWKFVCSRKKVQDIKEESNDDTFRLFTKNAETVWKLEPSGAWGINMNNELEFPPFVFRAVKIFEEFLQTTERPNDQNGETEYTPDFIELESKKESGNECKQEWISLVVRCNSMDELMLFATGRNINRTTMDRFKQTFESGLGKDCNVKSLYCKSTNKVHDITVTNTTFLVGSEALDEIVGGLKVQLAPKTNFWSNTAGAENVANAVMDLLALTPKTTVIEIGCGIGLIGLMMASKCHHVVGVDLPSEVEEAEMTCELNNIKNASFIMGTASEVTSKIVIAAKKSKPCAIINANTNIGRAIEVMTCLRKIASIKRIVMITTLTKQSVRAILELARPLEIAAHGAPFVPTVACVVDTLPVGPLVEVVILLERRAVHKLNAPPFQKSVQGLSKETGGKPEQKKTYKQKTNGTEKKVAVKEAEARKSLNKLLTKFPTKKTKPPMKRVIHPKNIEAAHVKGKFKGKRPHSPDMGEAPPKKVMKKFSKFNTKPWQPDVAAKKKKEWNTENPHILINPLYEKKLREQHTEQADLRERLSNNRLDTDIAQRVKEHQSLLKIAKEKLSGPTPTVDINTAKQLQSMLNMVLEQTNKLQSQLPRSVWDRIAPADNVAAQRDSKEEESLSQSRYVHDRNGQDILITTANKFSNNEMSDPKPYYKKYNNIPPLEPNTIEPVGPPTSHSRSNPFRISPDRYHDTNMRDQLTQDNWNRDNKSFERNRWNEMGNMRKPNSPLRRQNSPMKHRLSPPKRFSPKRPLLSPPRRPSSPPRRHFSPMQRPSSPLYRQRSSPMRGALPSPLRRPMSPLRRASPQRRPQSPRRPSPPRRPEMTMNRPMSPLRQDPSVLRRQVSPLMIIVSPTRRQMSPTRPDTSTPRRQDPSPNRMMSPNTQEMMLSRRQIVLHEKQQMSPMRRAESPQRYMFMRPTSPPRRQPSPPRRQMSPQQRFADDWDIPSRGAVEQNIWQRPPEKLPAQNVWRNDKPSTSTNNWDQNSTNDSRRKVFCMKKWGIKDSNRDDTWNIGAGSSWNPKQPCQKPIAKETWQPNPENKWWTTSKMPENSNDNWNIRGKESFNARKEPWMDNTKKNRWETYNAQDSWKQNDKDDLNDLPEDARDPWGDDGNNLGLKERWLKSENTASSSSSSTWKRENDKPGNMWLTHQDNWQNKDSSFAPKSQWQNNGIKNMGELCSTSQNDNNQKPPSSTWQSGKNVGSWQTQNTNFQPHRSFSTSQFKGFH